MPELRIRLFGHPVLEANGSPRRITRRKVSALLAYLAMASRPFSRDELAELLFPRMERERAYADLRQTLSYLKAELGDDILQVSVQAVQPLHGNGIHLDVAEFRALVGRAAGARELEDLRAAVKLCRGSFLQGFFLKDSPSFEEWQSGVAEELDAQYAAALVRLHDLEVQRGSLEEAIECARRLATLDRLDEPAVRRLMGTLAAAGRTREAVRQYESFRALLAREVQAEPETQTRELAERVRRGQEARKAVPAHPRRRRILLAAGLAAGLVVCAAGGWVWHAHGRGVWPFSPAAQTASRREISIGVLPFENLSDDPGQSYFCDGLSEDLMSSLASIPVLKLPARSTLFTYKDRSTDARDLRRDLGVSYVLEGSVRKSGDDVRINARLIETAGAQTVWAKKFDRKLSGIFEIQDDIVRSIVTELDVSLVSGEQARLWRATTRNAEAYDRFLRAVDYTANPDGFARSVSLLNQALALDPDFTAALCWKAIFLVLQARLGWVADPALAMREARTATERALALDRGYADAHAALGMLEFHEGKLREAERQYGLALSLGPSMETTNSVCAAFYAMKKDYPRALSLIRKAKEVARLPGSQTIAWEIVILRNMNRLEEARAVALDGLKRWPNGLDMLVNYANVCRLMKHQDELAWAIKRIVEVQPDFSSRQWVDASGVFTGKAADRYAEDMRRAGFPP